MLNVKPYISRTQCPLSISDISLRLSQSHPTPTIVCAKRHGWSQPSNRKMLQLASTIAFNLKILPEPLNSLAGQFARGDCDTLNHLVGGWRGKVTRNRNASKKNSVWFAFVFICVACGFWSWRIREFDLFLRALSFCLAAISLFRLWLGKKAIREWLLGFGKEDVNFWVQKLVSSPLMQSTVNQPGDGYSSRVLIKY
ncbi:hypothetical protein CR513_36603, partial [Mucuna pruriens]